MKDVIIFDFNNLAVRTFFVKDVGATSSNVAYNLWRYMLFDAIYKSLFRIEKATELVLAIDDRLSWRKLYFKRYKESRKPKRDKSDVNWPDFFRAMENFVSDIKEYIPFKVLEVQNAEADDIIGVICNEGKDNYTVVSTDEDFLQLCKKNVRIYNPMKKEEMVCEDTEEFIVRKSLTGQSKDDIFNIKTPLDWGQTPETEGKRKPGFGPKSADKVMRAGYKKWLEENGLEERFKVNRVLIDFNYIPKVIKKRVLDAYYGYELPDPAGFYNFCKLYRFKGYTDEFTKFENTLMRMYE
jgi:hypothetical protein